LKELLLSWTDGFWLKLEKLIQLLEHFNHMRGSCEESNAYATYKLKGIFQCCGSMTFWCGSGSAPLANGSGFGSGSFYFHHWPSKCKQIKKMFFFCILPVLLKIILNHFSKIERQKSHNSRNQDFSYHFCLIVEGFGSIPLTDVSGSRRPKNIRIRWIRIQDPQHWNFLSNTDSKQGKRRILPYFVNLFFSFSGKPKHVLLLTTTNPILGRTVDDGKEKPAIVMFYNYTMGKSGK